MKPKNLLLLTSLLFTVFTARADINVGIIVPLEHQAMTEIVNGFETTLTQQYHQPIHFKVANAQNDQNLQHAIIQQMRDGHYDLIVPIATQTSQMTISIIKDKPIIALATDINENQRQKMHPCNVAIVDDEISDKQIIDFIHQTYPSIKNLALIHSASEKILPEVAEAKAAGKMIGVNIHDITIQSLLDLQNISHNLPSNTQGIFILKDNLVVSGIAQLNQLAKTKHIPLISSDEGSVENGAGFAVGVRESQIGVKGAQLALQILEGKKACNLPISKMTELFVFVNQEALKQSGQDMQTILQIAKKLNYKTVMVQAKTAPTPKNS